MKPNQLVGAFLTAALLLSACSGTEASLDTSETSEFTDSEPDETTTTADQQVLPEYSEATRNTVVVPDSHDDDAEEVMERYLLYKEARLFAAGPPFADPSDSTLGGLMTGEKEEVTLEFLEGLEESGTVLVIPEDTDAESRVQFAQKRVGLKKVEGNTIVIQDCETVDFQIERLSDGEVVTERVASTILWNIQMQVVDGEWKISKAFIEKEYEGVNECTGDFAL